MFNIQEAQLSRAQLRAIFAKGVKERGLIKGGAKISSDKTRPWFPGVFSTALIGGSLGHAAGSLTAIKALSRRSIPGPLGPIAGQTIGAIAGTYAGSRVGKKVFKIRPAKTRSRLLTHAAAGVATAGTGLALSKKILRGHQRAIWGGFHQAVPPEFILPKGRVEKVFDIPLKYGAKAIRAIAKHRGVVKGAVKVAPKLLV